MDSFFVKTKNNSNPQGKRRVYFTCHPDDEFRCFGKICNDIFRTQDCAIYCTNDLSVSYGREFDTALRQMNLFVIPVSKKLLSRKNRAMDEEFPFAMREHIPVLPIMIEPANRELDELFRKRFGDMQYLDACSMDDTAISYEEKLERFLKSVLIGDDLAERVRAAFDAYIFLSYRKKDRVYANELMRLIHKNPKCRDFAIWYDEFLVPGEDFNSSINEALKKSDFFAMLVTPNLVNEENYVHSIEYPEARKEGKPIFPAEMVLTDRTELLSQYDGIPECVRTEDFDGFNKSLSELVFGMARRTPSTDPVHNFLIGLAYMEGIDMERNPEMGLGLITSAAEAGLVEAMDRLAYMYRYGKGVERNVQKWSEWEWRIQEALGNENECDQDLLGRKAGDYISSLIDTGDYENAIGELESLLQTFLSACESGEEGDVASPFARRISECYLKLGNTDEALRYCEMAVNSVLRSRGETDDETIKTQNQLAEIHIARGDNKIALAIYQHVYDVLLEIYGEGDPRPFKALSNLANMYISAGDFHRALDADGLVYERLKKLLGERAEETISSMFHLALCYSLNGEHEKTVTLLKKAYRMLTEREPGADEDLTQMVLQQLANEYREISEYDRALEILSKMYEDRCRIYGAMHSYTIAAEKDLSQLYMELGDYNKALELIDDVYISKQVELGHEHPETVDILFDKSQILREIGSYRESLALNRDMYDIYRRTLGEEHIKTVIAHNEMAADYLDLEDYGKALEIYEKSYEILKRTEGDGSMNTLLTRLGIARCYHDLGNIRQAVSLLEDVYTIQQRIYGADNEFTLLTGDLLEEWREETGGF